MAWFKNMFRKDAPTDDPTPAVPQPAQRETIVFGGAEQIEVVGESHYQDQLRRIAGDESTRVRLTTTATLLAENDNPYDSNAVSVWIAGSKVGHLSRNDAASLRPGLLRLVKEHQQPIALPAVIVGGGSRNDGSPAAFGVWLSYDPADFGLDSAPSEPRGAAVRTGLSVAVATDLADDSYDLGWMDGLSEDRGRRVQQLRRLLDTESEPVSRHFVFSQLESDLYALRDLTPTMLDEYDTAAEQHDGEMDIIRPALLTKFGNLPLLETYKQSCIRQAKAKNLERGLWWARRGLVVYGTESANLDWVLDLQKRVDRLTKQIAKADDAARRVER